MNQNRRWLCIGRSTGILSGVVDVDVFYQQIVCESFSILGELRQPWFRFEAQHLWMKRGCLQEQNCNLISLIPCP